MKLLVAGDFCDNHRVKSELRDHNYSLLFDDVKAVIEESDYSIVNFEFPIAKTIGSPIQKQGPNLKGQVEAIDALKYAGINVCTLANKHILDQGEKCCVETVELLQQAGIKTIGAGRDIEDASKPLILQENKCRVGIINCCEHEFSIASRNHAGAQPLDVIKQYYQILELKKSVDYVIIIVHGGIEHYQLPTPRMIEVYRFFVDAGADVVINHHQHCYSGYEEYKGKPIFYGLGNFLFDWNGRRNGIWNEGYMVSLVLAEDGIKYDLIPYYQANETPSVVRMTGDDMLKFQNNVAKINDIIGNPKAISDEYETLVARNARGFLGAFEPYNNRILRALFHRGYIPSLLSKRHLIYIYGYLRCESHFDQLVKVLKSKIQQ